ncbi:methyltransferase [Phenylobacterium sp. J367]|uniref:methyltransferase n=1 Tax=Phenylobacterium sp. J367 TaxID=2898435 RepID=UPI002150D8AC|nr:methyltransferase [Phenylobacterium sp. J367]MCR5878993.1 methyltransferase [Phenylobacterium sp. J367]
MPSYTEAAGEHLRRMVSELSEPATIKEMENILHFLARWRSRLLANTYAVHEHNVVQLGPFAGLHYATRATEGAMMPRLLGTYETELHPHLLRFAAQDLDCVIDVGCAEGYYAVGLARLMPGVTVHAFDTSADARAACALNARDNGVEAQVVIGATFAPEDFQAFAGRRALVIMDVEGAEDELLLPDRAPALAHMRVIVETHEGHRPGVRQRLIDRFSPTHEVLVVDHGGRPQTLPPWIRELGHLDHLLAVWEFRTGPTPWLVMTPKSG